MGPIASVFVPTSCGYTQSHILHVFWGLICRAFPGYIKRQNIQNERGVIGADKHPMSKLQRMPSEAVKSELLLMYGIAGLEFAVMDAMVLQAMSLASCPDA